MGTASLAWGHPGRFLQYHRDTDEEEALEEKGQAFHAPNSHVGGGGSWARALRAENEVFLERWGVGSRQKEDSECQTKKGDLV